MTSCGGQSMYGYYKREDLLKLLQRSAPSQVAFLEHNSTKVFHGLLPVGLKLLIMQEQDKFDVLINHLLGARESVDHNLYAPTRPGSISWVLPPFGSARAAIALLEAMEAATDCMIFGNPNIQIQVCSPGRLKPRNVALHTIAFLLGSDDVRVYAREDLETTVSKLETTYDVSYTRGSRLAIYDGNGDLDRDFAFHALDDVGNPKIMPTLPFYDKGRTDIKSASFRCDIENINLTSTLLVHAQFRRYRGRWQVMGDAFTEDMVTLLRTHGLIEILDAPWVSVSDELNSDVLRQQDQQFFETLMYLTGVMQEDRARVKKLPEGAPVRGGILADADDILQKYHRIVRESEE